ncbi:MAG: prephenate dehydrogenase [Bacteroidetes bacterium]|nr:prephenate dehydrogenase [Bacteroidota bacterium]
MNITIVGLGLIGGSLAIDLRARKFGSEFWGVDSNEHHASKAQELGLVDNIVDLEHLFMADLVVLAIPVDQARNLLPKIMQNINSQAVVVDIGSTKQGICQIADQLPNRDQYVASHPISGTENVGPEAAIANLFRGNVTIICDQEKCRNSALELIRAMYKTLGMKVIYMDPKDHDLHIAYVSHLSHISSFTLGLTVLEIEKNEKNIFNMAGSGFASTVRLAKSSADMWVPIFEQNASNLSKALQTYIDNLIHFKKLIDHLDKTAMFRIIHQSNEIRRVLDGIELKEKANNGS